MVEPESNGALRKNSIILASGLVLLLLNLASLPFLLSIHSRPDDFIIAALLPFLAITIFALIGILLVNLLDRSALNQGDLVRHRRSVHACRTTGIVCLALSGAYLIAAGPFLLMTAGIVALGSIFGGAHSFLNDLYLLCELLSMGFIIAMVVTSSNTLRQLDSEGAARKKRIDTST
ncbi:MAG: hypothetical protein LBO07_04065 [Coriobacteriales bacterium]|nr:hypothetical protein [Coriobacteriales bacterium]